MRPAAPGFLLVLSLSLPAFGQGGEVKITSDTFGGIQARSIGPAVMSGRIAAIDAVPGPPLTIYVGAAGGGVWKSKDAGTTFEPIFDRHTQSIGAIRVDPSDPKKIWVGTGETWVRNSVSVGDGVYRSTDAGETWQHVGLKDSERIARILVDPRSGDTVYVCATGRLWSPGEERGVFKTTDGGKSWRKVLYVDENTGCSDLAIDPQDPKILYAGMWQFRRRPDFFVSGGPGSGLFKSTDGGETWSRRTRGLPETEKGRIAVAVAPSRPSVVYALVEAKRTALYRSDDLGESWTEMNSSFNVISRPFYFALVVVDPTDFNMVYKPGFSLGVSVDGGRSFNSPLAGGFGGGVHSDLHALWINPANPHQVLLGTDGGVYVSNDRAHHWALLKNLPVSQLYHVSYDMQRPYNVYGGLQDNGSWTGPSRSPAGIENRDWANIGFGDGMWSFADPRDPDTLYVEYQGGNMLRVDRSTLETKEVKPYARAGEKELRFNWNAPIHLSPTDPGTIYIGAQYLLRSRDKGESWEQISPDLTTNDPARQKQAESGGLSIDNSTAENNTTIYTICESPKNHSLVWVGTDDGLVHVTRDAGATWADVTSRIPGVPAGTWVSRLEASPHAEGTAFVTFDGHRSGDMKPYLLRTDDFGATWRSLVTSEIEGYAFVIRQDTVNPEILFLGTEFGLYVTLDGGRQWARFTGGLPRVAVHDIAIHPREQDLVLATHGRGIYIVDDLTPIRALTQETIDKEFALLPSRPSEMPIQASVQQFEGDADFVGRNPSEAASITYWLKKRHLFGDLKVEVYDAGGELISTVPGTKRVGINRVDWPMRLKAPTLPPSANLVPAFEGPRVAEGSYRIRLVKGKESQEGKVDLVADARSPHSREDRALQQKTAMQLYRDLARLAWVADNITGARDQARQRIEKAGARSALGTRLGRIASSLEEMGKKLAATSETGLLSGEEQLKEKIANLYGAVNQYDGRPTASQLDRMKNLEGELEAAAAAFDAMAGREIAGTNRMLEKAKLEPIRVLSMEEWTRRSAGGAAASAGPPGGPSGLDPERSLELETLARRFLSAW